MENTKTQQEAAEWLVELKTTDDIDASWPAFYAWYELPENRAAYLELEQAWGMTKQALAPSVPCRLPVADRFVDEVRAVALRRRVRYRIGVSPVLFAGLACLITVFLLLRVNPHASWSRYETNYGEISSIQLADGSQIRLNTKSRMWARLTSKFREVSLEQGEALFTVASDPSRPFSVLVDKDVLRALGTEFFVRREPGGNVSASVTKGTIELLDHDRPESNRERRSDKLLRASAGDIINITATRRDVVTVGTSGVQHRLAWLRGQIDVDGTLADAVAEFNRYNRRRLEITDATVSKKRIQGLFTATDPDAFAREVRNKLGVPYTSFGSASSNTGVIRIGAVN